jgi:hypothetical protein
LDFLTQLRQALIVPGVSPPGTDRRFLVVYDGLLRKRIEMGISREQGYEVRGGREFPRGGLRVLRVYEEVGLEGLREHDLRTDGLALEPQDRAATSPTGRQDT